MEELKRSVTHEDAQSVYASVRPFLQHVGVTQVPRRVFEALGAVPTGHDGIVCEDLSNCSLFVGHCRQYSSNDNGARILASRIGRNGILG